MLTKETLSEWRQNPTTRDVFKRLRTTIGEIEEEIGQGRTLVLASAEETHALTAHEVGRVAGIKEVLDFTMTEDGEE